MTMLASWVGVDTHGQTSAYIVSESRITWPGGSHYDFTKKVFAAKSYPDIFGYAGEVLFPSIALSQIVEMIDAGVFFTQEMDREEKHSVVYEKLQEAFLSYPANHCDSVVQILHISRDTTFLKYPVFSAKLFQWSKQKGWRVFEYSRQLTSGLLCNLGSNQSEFADNLARYQTGPNQNTSRSIFHCFIDTLSNTKDQKCGGAPQLVGVFRKPDTNAINFGIVYKNKRFFLGSELTNEVKYDNIQWRNELFELVDGNTKQRFASAAEQPDPLRRR